MEITLVETIFVDGDTFLHIGFHLQILVEYQRSARLDQCGIVPETFQISLFCSIDVEMVGIGRGDDRHPRTEPMERTVELISFNHHVVAVVREDIVCAVVLGDASKEGVAVNTALVHDMSAHRRGSRLAVSTSNTQSFVRASQRTQYLCTFLNLKSFLTEIDQFLVLSRDSRCVDDQRFSRNATGLWNQFHIFCVMNQHAFLLQYASQV